MSKRPESLSDIVVVIAGASSGFGRGAAQKLAAEGARVVIAARRKSMLDDLVTEIETAGGTAVAVETDVSEPVDIARLVQEALTRFGRIDVWVNNVGVGAIGYFWDIPIEDHARLVDVNLKGLIFGAHAANYTGHAPRMAMMDDPQIVIDAIVKACIDPAEEQPVGWKAKGSDIMHHVFPDLTERMSADLAKAESGRAMSAPNTTGALHQPMSDGRKIDGGYPRADASGR